MTIKYQLQLYDNTVKKYITHSESSSWEIIEWLFNKSCYRIYTRRIIKTSTDIIRKKEKKKDLG